MIVAQISLVRDVGDPLTADHNTAARWWRNQTDASHWPRRVKQNKAARLPTDDEHVSLVGVTG
jgi:hypothetical protein